MTHATATPAHLIHLAARTSPASLKAAREALKAAGLRQTQAPELVQALKDLNKARREAPAQRLARRLGYWPIAPQLRDWAATPVRVATRKPTHGTPGSLKGGSAPRATLPIGTPAQRLQDLREGRIAKTYERQYRTATHGDILVHLTTDPTAVGIRQVEGTDWDLYRGAHKGRPARTQDTHITAPTTWRDRVLRHGLAVVDGMMTLDAALIEAQGCELFAATWLVQGRGTTTSAARGYIARADGATYHGATIDQAISGLTKKRRALQFVAKLADTEGLADLAAAHGAARVTLGDARAVGACEYGTRSWCHAVGIDYDAGQTTLAAVLAGYHREPRPEARAVILRVLRRQRATA